MSWAKVPVDPLVVFKTRQVLWPTALMHSVYSFWKVTFEDDIKRAFTRVGIYTGPPPPTREQISASHQKQLQNLLKDSKGTPTKTSSPPKLPDAKKTMSVALPDESPLQNTVKDGAIVNTTDQASSSGQTDNESKDMRVTKAIYDRYYHAVIAFKQKFAQSRKPMKANHPRGSIRFSGLVYIETEKAFVTFDVTAFWDPKTESYDSPSFRLGLRNIQQKVQHAAA